MSPWFDLIVAILATWRLCYLIAREDGPFDLILRLRLRAGASMAGKLMDCPYCLSLWVAAPIALSQTARLRQGVLLWLAIAGGASLTQMVVEALRAMAQPPIIDLPLARPDATMPATTHREA